MATESKVRILYVETDKGDLRAVEFYLQGFASGGWELQVISAPEQVEPLKRDAWDVILVRNHCDDPTKSELLDQVKRRVGSIPVIDLGDRGGDLIASADETALDEYLPRVRVSGASLLRSVGHLLARRHQETEIEEMKKRLGEASRLDSITGVWNRSYIAQRISEEIENTKRHGTPLAIGIFDVVDFDCLNEQFGYEVGDRVLRRCAEIIREQIRNTDYVGRFGSDSFCLVFPKATTEDAMGGVKRMHRAIRSHLFTGKSAGNFTIEICFGLVQLPDPQMTVDDFLSVARQTLSKAKLSGPGTIEVCKEAEAA